MNILDWLAQGKGELLTAGVVGAAVSAAVEWTGVWNTVRKLIVGAGCAVYLAPMGVSLISWVLDGVNVPTTNAAGMSGFLMGIGGIVVVEIILGAFRLKKQQMSPKQDGEV